MTEDAVITIVADYLREAGWTIARQLSGNAAGIDIVAQHGDRVLHIEAKGSATIRDGASVDHRQQHRTNSAIAALGKAMMLWQPDVKVALALPRERVFRNHVYTARIALRTLGISVFWVSSDGSVEWSEAHDLRDAPRRRLTRAGLRRDDVTCRSEILDAARRLQESGWPDFAPDDIVRALQEANSQYQDVTIRTHVVSLMCVDAPANHATRYSDLERVARGRYRLRGNNG